MRCALRFKLKCIKLSTTILFVLSRSPSNSQGRHNTKGLLNNVINNGCLDHMSSLFIRSTYLPLNINHYVKDITLTKVQLLFYGLLEYNNWVFEKLCRETQILTELPTFDSYILRAHVIG